jgi:PST family polysaccharide transporter
MTRRQPGARAQTAKSVAVTGSAQAYKVAISFVSNVALARLLTPADFGLVATVSTIVAFVWMVQELGLSQATIQRAQISHAQISALFWLTIGFSLALALILGLCAPAIAWFFGDARIVRLTLAFAFLVILSGAQSQHLALLNREMHFTAIAAIDILGVTCGAVAGVLTAWLTASYWALFAGTLATVLASSAAIVAVSGFRPGKPSFEGEFKAILHFGAGVSGFNIVNYFARNADKLLIGKFYGVDQLGLYDRAYRLLLFPLEQVRNPLGRVMLPTLSRMQGDPARYRAAYTECIAVMMMVSQPAILFVTIFADSVLTGLLGPHWLPIVPIFQWLGICALHQVSTSSVGWLFLSQGRGGDYFKIGLFNAATTVASFAIGLPWGAVGVAAAYTISDYIVRLPATLWSAGRRGPVTAGNLVAAMLPHAVATAVAGAVLLAIALARPAPNLAAQIGIGVLSYFVYGLVILAFPAKRVSLMNNYLVFVGMLPSVGRV